MSLHIPEDLASKTLNANYDYLCEVCHPLFKNTPLRYFDYLRCYDDGTTTTMSVSPDFVTKILSEFLLPTLEEFQLFSLFHQKATYLSTLTSLPPGASELDPEKYEKNIVYAAENNIFHRLYIVERAENYYVTFGFGVTDDNRSIINFYLNALPYLERFVRYFDYHMTNIIEAQLQEFNIILPEYQRKTVEQKFNISLPSLNTNDLSISKDHSDKKIIEIDLTPREKLCLQLIAQGYTMKNAAKRLEISHRTVEQHLRNIKDKLGITTKNQLVEIWHEYTKNRLDDSFGKF